MESGYLRISEFSQRVGVSAERLRAWEQRYGVLAPERSPGGFRLYSDADVARVQAMLAHLERGVSAAEAARLAKEATGPAAQNTLGTVTTVALEGRATTLRERLEAFDEAGADTVLDDLLATFTLETVLRDAVLPCLAELGERWASGAVTVGQEHFATNLLRGRLLGLAQGWGQGVGPRAVLAAPPGELHDLALIVCGLALSRQGLRVVFLGADCPVDTLRATVRTVRPALVVLAASDTAHVTSAGEALRALAAEVPVHLAGAGASPELATDLGARYVGEDPVSAAALLAAPPAAVDS